MSIGEIKIVHLISSIGFFGAENVMIELAKELHAYKYTPIIGVIGNSCNAHMAVVKEAEKNSLIAKVFNGRGKFDIRTALEIRKYIKENKIKIIHSHNYKSNFYAVLASMNTDIRKITTCHNWIGKNMKMKFYEYLDKLLLRRFDKVVVVSETLKDEIGKCGVSADKLFLIKNGIDINRFRTTENRCKIRTSLGISENDFLLGTVGRLTSEKGHIYLLKACKETISQYPCIKLLIIGDGPLRKSLELAAENIGLKDKVIFSGMTSNIPEMLNIMDIFVLPSLTEGMPMALLEAMVSKKSVIATKVGSVPMVIKDCHSGLLVESANVNQLSQAILSLLKDRTRAEFLSQNAYETVNSNFTAQRMTKKYIEIYDSLYIKY